MFTTAKMVTAPQVKQVLSDRITYIRFSDDSTLYLSPQSTNLEDGLHSAALYIQGRLEARVYDRPHNGQRTEDTGFWTRGSITQQEFSVYYSQAITYGEALERSYAKGMISIDEWEISPNYETACKMLKQCTVLEASLRKGTLNIFNQDPI